MEVKNKMKPSEQTFNARPYQNEILKVALQKNAIIFLPTGSGKTYIAIMAIKEMSAALEKSIDAGGKRTVFLTNTVALARQQYECIKQSLNLKTTIYTGDMNVDNWKREKWREEFDQYQVVIATAQIILDVIRHGFMTVMDFNLMIFDECHHAVNDHPMIQLMGHFQNQPVDQLPRVIGLTGLLLKSSSAVNIEEDLNKLEAVFRATIVTVSDYSEYKNVLVYSTKPAENVIKYMKDPVQPNICAKIKKLIAECIAKVGKWNIDMNQLKATRNLEGNRKPNPIKKTQNLLTDFDQKIDDMGVYGASIAILSFMVELELKKRSAETIAIRNMARLCISYAERIRHELVEYMKLESEDDDVAEMIMNNCTQKMMAFIVFLEKTFTGKKMKDISCLVFVERRQTAKCLYYVVKHFLESRKSIPIVPEFMVGQSRGMPESIETYLEVKRSKNILRNFKRGDCNMVIASSVLEEGIDVQSCNYVIMYDDIKHFGSYVQTKGRARMANSVYSVMVCQQDLQKVVNKITKFREMEAGLKKYLVGKTIDRAPPLQEQIDEQFSNDIEPFYTPGGAVLEAGSVIQLLNRYCMTLPQDSYTSSTVQWSKTVNKNGKIIVSISMPAQSTIKEDVLSDPMVSTKLAKRSAALKACKMLYENKELNENLLPVSKVNCFDQVDDLYFNHWKDFPADIARLAGTMKNKRSHDIQQPDQLNGAMPQPGTDCYLHAIHLMPTFQKNPANEHILNWLGTSSNFAILTAKPLPRLAKIPMFVSQGEVTVEIAPVSEKMKVETADNIQLLRNFHLMLFRDLLELWKTFFASNFENKENSFLIVPTNNNVEIDWELVKRFQRLPKARQLSELQRSKLKFNAADYENSVLCPWYSADQNTRYVVLKVLTDVTPNSPFPNGCYDSYASYVHAKYSLNIIVKDQFMLLVQPLTSRRSLIHPGDGDGGGRKKALSRHYDNIQLIPELCHNFGFPGDLWFKSIFLPTLLHRLNYLLIAENLRVQINRHVGLSSLNHSPKKLIVDKLKLSNSELIESLSEEYDDDEQMPGNEKEKGLLVEKVNILDTNCGWQEYKEPVDIDRHIDQIYEMELDYYMQFISSDLQTLKLDEKAQSVSEPKRLPKVPAICDNPEKISSDIEMFRKQSEIDQGELLVAITLSAANDVFSMERLELLGDSFLKLGASFYSLYRHVKWNEGCLTALKCKFVSNRNLFYHSKLLNLPGMLNTNQFNPRNEWQPPLVSIPVEIQKTIESHDVSPNILWKLELDDDEIQTGKVKEETLLQFIQKFPFEDADHESTLRTLLGKRTISDKCCADAVEAILGVCVKNLGVQRSFLMLQFFGICPKTEDLSNLLNISLGSPRLSPTVKDSQIDVFILNYRDLEGKLGYKFNDRAYLLQALTHPSYPTNRLTGCYQVLEFLGDAVLDFLISTYIYERCEHMGPGELTDLRSALVNNVFLACLTVRNKFHLYILSQSAVLMQAIENFVRFQESENNRITDQVRILIQEDECSIADYIEVPKALGDIFEAIIGAVFLDSGNNLEKTWNVIYKLMSDEIMQYMVKVPKQLVRELYEFKGANATFSDPVVNEDISMVTCTFNCRGKLLEVTGFGNNKESAKISAAKLALQSLTKS